MNAKALKGIAIAAMVIDHLAWAFVPAASWPGQIMHAVGRITGPIMFFFIAEGYAHTHNVKRYAYRLVVFATISQFPYIYFWTGKLPTPQNLLSGNVLFTLFLGLLAIAVIQRNKKCSAISPMLLFNAAMLFGIASINCDWSHWGVIFILAFHLTRENPKERDKLVLAITIARFLCIWRAETVPVANLFQLAIPLVLPLLHRYNGERGKGGKWTFYLFYPAHLLIIGFLRWRIAT